MLFAQRHLKKQVRDDRRSPTATVLHSKPEATVHTKLYRDP
jgi:hypothetical protein